MGGDIKLLVNSAVNMLRLLQGLETHIIALFIFFHFY